MAIHTGRDGDPAHVREFGMFVSRTLHAAADQVEPCADGLERIRAKIRLAQAHAGATRPGLAGLARWCATIRDRWYETAARTTRLRGRIGNKRRAHHYGRAGGTLDLREVLLRPAVAIACAVFAAGVALALPPLRQEFIQLSSAASSALFSSKSGGASTTGGGKPTGNKPQCSEPSEQCEYQNIILRDRSALSPGFILIQDPISIRLGQSYDIRVAVCGKSVAMCSEYAVLGTARTEPEPSRFQGKLLIGARIQASLEGTFPGS